MVPFHERVYDQCQHSLLCFSAPAIRGHPPSLALRGAPPCAVGTGTPPPSLPAAPVRDRFFRRSALPS